MYTGFQGSRQADARIAAVAGGRVQVETTRPLQPQEGLTLAVAWPKGLIAEPSAAQQARWLLRDNGAAIALLAGLLAPLAWYLWAWDRVGRDPRKGVIIPRFEPPPGLSPAACRYVRDMSLSRDAFTAAIISLAVKGWMIIEERGDDFSLAPTSASGGGAPSPGERLVLDCLLPRAGSRLEMDRENHQVFQAARQIAPSNVPHYNTYDLDWHLELLWDMGVGKIERGKRVIHLLTGEFGAIEISKQIQAKSGTGKFTVISDKFLMGNSDAGNLGGKNTKFLQEPQWNVYEWYNGVVIKVESLISSMMMFTSHSVTLMEKVS